MTAAAIVSAARADGVRLALTPAGTLKLKGPQPAVSRWAETIRQHKPEIIDLLAQAANDPAADTPHTHWLLTYPGDQPGREISLYPPATYQQVMAWHPDACAALPFDLPPPAPPLPMPEDQEQRVRAWLASIGETDPDTIHDVIHACKTDGERRHYFLSRAGELALPQATGCTACRHRALPRGSIEFCGSGRADLALAYTEGHPLRRLPTDGGTDCSSFDPLPF